MNLTVTVTNHNEQAAQDRHYWRNKTPEDRLSEVERLRLEAAKFLYHEYPTRLRRVIKVTRKTWG
jgi:hypothetical protein